MGFPRCSPTILQTHGGDGLHRHLVSCCWRDWPAMASGTSTGRRRHSPTMSTNGRMRIMQPNLQQDQRFNYKQKDVVMARYIALSERSGGPSGANLNDITHLIWPESAFPFFLTREAGALAQLADLLPEGTVLITGAVRAPETVPVEAVTRAYNSIYVLDHDGTILSVY